ncbi:MAG: helix-turn-helix domain-containing protein [Hydrogenovibrio sp.]
MSEKLNKNAFTEYGKRYIDLIVEAKVSLGRKPSIEDVRNYFNNIEPLLMEYGRDVLSRNGPEGWDKTMNQIRDNLDPKTLPFALKDRNPEAIALLKTVEQLEFYDPVLDGLLSAFKYDQEYFYIVLSYIEPFVPIVIEKALKRYSMSDKPDNFLEINPNYPLIKLDLSRLTQGQWGNFIENMDKSFFKKHMVDIVTGNDFLSDPKDLVILMKSDNKTQQVVLELNPSVFNLKDRYTNYLEKNFATQISQLMDEYGTKKLSEMTSISDTMLRKWRNGESEPSLTSLLKIVDSTGVTLDWITGRV